MAISRGFTFNYRFAVSSQNPFWSGQGEGNACYGNVDRLVGPRPRFELQAGWLTLFPTEGRTQSVLTREFSDVERPPLEPAREAAMYAAAAESREAYKEAEEIAAKTCDRRDIAGFTEAIIEAMPHVHRRLGITRDVASYALLVGEGLGTVLQIGDTLEFVRNGNGDFPERAQWPGVTPEVHVRVKGQMFRLLNGQEVYIDPYYVPWARGNTSAIGFEFAARAVYAAGRLDPGIQKELFIDAARQLTAAKVRLL